MEKRVYIGNNASDNEWDTSVTVNDQPLENVHPTKINFTWGYSGAGPVNLALCIIVDFIKSISPQDPCLATPYSNDFMAHAAQFFSKNKIQKWSDKKKSWTLTEKDVQAMLKRFKKYLFWNSRELLERYKKMSPYFLSLKYF